MIETVLGGDTNLHDETLNSFELRKAPYSTFRKNSMNGMNKKIKVKKTKIHFLVVPGLHTNKLPFFEPA